MNSLNKSSNTTAPPVGTAFKQPTVLAPALRYSYRNGEIATYDTGKTEKQLLTYLLDTEELKSLHPTGTVLQGTLNYNFVLSDPDGNLYVWRAPKEHPQIIPIIHQDLIGTGFLINGGSYRYRTIREQVNFMTEACRLHLQNVEAITTNAFGTLLPFIQGTPYDNYLRQGGIEATKNVLDNIVTAHKHNIVYGDRWTKNTIIKPDEGIVEIDFDIELRGEIAQEFEMAQLLYHILFFSSQREKMLDFLKSYLQINQTALAGHDFFMVRKFLSNYANYFQDKIVEGIAGGIEQEIAELIKILLCLF